uniref:Uncharacterized protein n=1 Tax=Anguilla anguilla TaxID=7936 RepID=A0A0E9QN30_ANGAN
MFVSRWENRGSATGSLSLREITMTPHRCVNTTLFFLLSHIQFPISRLYPNIHGKEDIAQH